MLLARRFEVDVTNDQAEGVGDEDSAWEDHRGFIRRLNDRFGNVYGVGGGAVLLAGATVVLIAYTQQLHWHPAAWLASLSTMLVGLFGVRIVVRRRKESMRAELAAYCEANGVALDEVRSRFTGDGLYPYFEALFEARGQQPASEATEQ